MSAIGEAEAGVACVKFSNLVMVVGRCRSRTSCVLVAAVAARRVGGAFLGSPADAR
jgi:hypothetical protein